MIARRELASAQTPEGGSITLALEAGALKIRVDGQLLMASNAHGSEESMADFACAGLGAAKRARVLVAGLGLGYTLRAVLDRLPANAEVLCCEIVEAIAQWHEGPLGPLAGHPLRDPRVQLVVGDVVPLIAQLAGGGMPRLDAILLDVDNGPIPLTVVSNWWLYAAAGLRALYSSVRSGGSLVVWSASDDDRFAARMATAGFETRVVGVPRRNPRPGKRPRGGTHVLFVGRRP